MIEINGLMFGEVILQVRIEDLGGPLSEVTDYSVKLAVRDGDGDHIYQRTLHNVNKVTPNILGILQVILDELPADAQVALGGLWIPRHNDRPLELPS